MNYLNDLIADFVSRTVNTSVGAVDDLEYVHCSSYFFEESAKSSFFLLHNEMKILGHTISYTEIKN